MARRKVGDELRVVPKSFVPKFVRRLNMERRQSLDDRAALNSILFTLQTGIPWKGLPQELSFGSDMVLGDVIFRELIKSPGSDLLALLELLSCRVLVSDSKRNRKSSTTDVTDIQKAKLQICVYRARS
jgi:hypothetical protein